MLVGNVLPAANQPESRAVGQPLVTLVTLMRTWRAVSHDSGRPHPPSPALHCHLPSKPPSGTSRREFLYSFKLQSESARLPAFPLAVFLVHYDVDCLAEDVQGAITGTSGIRVTHMLCADDLCLTGNRPDQLRADGVQLMLDRLNT
eukprot:1140913-Pelagomonas_calceolata.AAC.7